MEHIIIQFLGWLAGQLGEAAGAETSALVALGVGPGFTLSLRDLPGALLRRLRGFFRERRRS